MSLYNIMDINILKRAAIAGVVWWFTYLYIRRYLNPENKKDVNKYKNDAIYGGIASFCSVLIISYINSL